MEPVMQQPAYYQHGGYGPPAGYPTGGSAGPYPEVAGPTPTATGAAKSSWTRWPGTKAELNHLEVPIGLLLTPFAENLGVQVVNYEPVKSRHPGGGVLNPFCHVDFRSKVWTDPFTGQRNGLPQVYSAHLTETNLCAELLTPNVEYALPNVPTCGPPTYLFVVDVSLFEEELDSLKDSLQQILGLLPADAVVGLITFGSVVYIHELGFSDCVKSYVFRGTKEVTQNDLQQQLKVGGTKQQAGPGAGSRAASQTSMDQAALANKRRFLCPLSDCEFVLNIILDDLQPDCWPTPSDQRAARCTGVAMSAAISLMECCCYQQSGRILLFTGGICTQGPGQVVGAPLSESIRQHLDLQKDTANAKYTKKACQYYNELAIRAVSAGHPIDLFCCSLDQCGLYEMKVCAERTGGVVVMSDTFSLNVFRDSLKKLFEAGLDGYVRNAFNVKVELLCTKEVKVCGAIGCVTSTNKKGAQVADLSVGQAGTCEWAAGVMDPCSTLAFFLDIANTNERNLVNKSAFIQIQITYTHPTGERRMRVFTQAFPFAVSGAGNNIAQIGSGFDQETATALMARLAVAKTETEEPLDILRWLDRKLIRLVSVFADYQKDKPQTFQLGQEFAGYPLYMYHLRRSHFLQTFNTSPDETAFYRTVLLRETLANSITMISPNLFEYNLTNVQPIPVELDSRALKPDVVLLLDSFFHLVVWHGEQIVRWREEGYHEMEKFAHLKSVLQLPLTDAKTTLQTRLPCPKFVVCNAGGSQARFLLAKVNPSNTHASLVQEFGAEAVGTSIITDDVSIKVFMEHLIKLATSA
eukprot:Protomagalhaensia_sp_Gyna_25__4915@NODE_525_length_3210_cov_35_992116_g61_i1_p1_GENE_NODE_525_length_3210_cov_35_992116_g61_i1NODE_525_length_3210_cov_35_992116_g61_i1_p1_ORF_typecomplete_len806_score147_65Sec23_trunk/PF04811_15/5_6e70Sec23_trunk/PF04811_15/4_9e03Sec23_helical/PF04815_15/1_1e24Sec23_BS/PF08033_12/5_2e21Sec23_BS/PF08033_12/1_4e04Gelsolin/PF00626_22/4_8e08zfSec23_Sec24/PF04810_15/3_5e07zfSec23_Sec24/PF04810_15/9_6e03VWA_3/PF13768_6/0_66VWA_3/PF13768_6/1_7e03_NODE_525_length_3210_c